MAPQVREARQDDQSLLPSWVLQRRQLRLLVCPAGGSPAAVAPGGACCACSRRTVWHCGPQHGLLDGLWDDAGLPSGR